MSMDVEVSAANAETETAPHQAEASAIESLGDSLADPLVEGGSDGDLQFKQLR